MNSSIDDLKTCKHVCMADMTCVAVDYIHNHKACWIHHDARSLHFLEKDAAVIHFQPVRCGLRGNSCITATSQLHHSCITAASQQLHSFYSLNLSYSANLCCYNNS